MALRWRGTTTSRHTANNRIVLGVLASLILLRSAVFVFWRQSYFDSDQAIFGLMAKHLIEGRAFPVFMYGQNYMLSVESWLAAPMFLIAGPSVPALKLPLLALNFFIVYLLLRFLTCETRLQPQLAALAAVFFVLPPPGTAAQFLDASGGRIEPLVYVLLLWLVRRRPVWLGLVLGFGFTHREFTIYGFVALLLIDVTRRTLFKRERLKALALTLTVAAVVWVTIDAANQFSSAMGPGTTVADMPTRETELGQLEDRMCIDVTTIPRGMWAIATVHWPLLFGTADEPLRAFNVESDSTQGLAWLGLVLAAAMLLAVVRIAVRVERNRWPDDYDFCAYLILAGGMSAAGYAIARCGVLDLARMRYDLLSILGAVGIAAWFLRIETSRKYVAVWTALIAIWIVITSLSYLRLWREYVPKAPAGGKERIIAALDARGVRYAYSDYRDAYVIAFLTNERILVASDDRVRIEEYQRQVAMHRSQAVRISHRRCSSGSEVLPGIYFCPP